MQNHITFGERLKQAGEALLGLFGVGVDKMEEVAESAQTTEMKLRDADMATEIDAQKTLDVINDGLTEFGKTKLAMEQQQSVVDHWDALARKAGADALKLTEGSPGRTAKEAQVKQALQQKDIAIMKLDVLKKAYDEQKPLADQALAQAEQVGFSREDALSQTAVLLVQNATAEGRLMLAKAARGGGLDRTKAMIEDAKNAVNESLARASATEAINATQPQDASALEAQIGISSRDQRVNDEFTNMMVELAGGEQPKA